MKNGLGLKKDSGITLMTLVITIIVLLILASVATYSGIEAIENTKMTTFTAELKIMQTYVNDWYEKNKNGNEDVLKNASNVNTTDSKIVEALEHAGEQSSDGFKFCGSDIKSTLGVEGVKQDVLVNIEKRKVVSYLGLKYKGNMYYTLDELPEGFYNVDYENKNTEKPTIESVNVTSLDNNSWKFTVNDIKYGGYVNKGKVLYQKDGDGSYWKETEDDYFIVTEPGKYNIKIVDSAGNESDNTITQYAYVKDGLILFYDGINNTRNGHDENTTVWEDLSGNNIDATLSNFNYTNESGWLSDGLICNGENNQFTTSDVNLPQNSDLSISITFKENKFMAYNRKNHTIFSSKSPSGLSWQSFSFHTWYEDKATQMLNGSIYIGGNYSEGGESDRFSPRNMKGYKTTEGKTDNITYVYKGDTKEAKLYINSALISTKTYTAEPQEITKFHSGIGNYKTYNNILIYNRALTDDEIKINYELDNERYKIQE